MKRGWRRRSRRSIQESLHPVAYPRSHRYNRYEDWRLGVLGDVAREGLSGRTIGGRLKSVVWQEIRSRRAIVTTAEEFFNVSKSLLPVIDVLYVESNVLRNRAQIAVGRWTTTPPQTIVGTHKLHHFKRDDGSDNIGTAVYSLSPVSKKLNL